MEWVKNWLLVPKRLDTNQPGQGPATKYFTAKKEREGREKERARETAATEAWGYCRSSPPPLPSSPPYTPPPPPSFPSFPHDLGHHCSTVVKGELT